MTRDWTGNSRSAHATMGARNYALNERETHDYYATEPKALELFLKKEKFSERVWECACGEGHLAKVLENHGYKVLSTDLVYRGYGVLDCPSSVIAFLIIKGVIDTEKVLTLLKSNRESEDTE